MVFINDGTESLKYVVSLILLTLIYGLAWYTRADYSLSAIASIFLLALLSWALESKAYERKSIDFSSASTIYLSVAFMGEGVLACALLMGGLCVRLLRHKHHLSEIFVTLPLLLTSAVLDYSGSWPTSLGGKLGLALLLISMRNFLLLLVAHHTSVKLAEQKLFVQSIEERELAKLGTAMSSLALFGTFVPLQQGWILTAFAPLLFALTRLSSDVIYRVRSQRAAKEIAAAEKTQRRLEATEKTLIVTSEKHELLEDLSEAFSGQMTPLQAFDELVRVTAGVVEYRSMVLFQRTQAGKLEPSYQHTPESDLLARYDLIAAQEPTVEKAWNLNRPIRGKTQADPSCRLIEAETFLLALPVKPLGVLYFGRTENAAFSKSEAGKVWFIVQKALPSLLRINQDAQTRENLRIQSQERQKLQEKVSLSTLLLQGARSLLASITEEQVFQSLETLLGTAVNHDVGLVYLNEDQSIRKSWGPVAVNNEKLVLELTGYLAKQERTVYLPELSRSQYGRIWPTMGSLLAAPIVGEQAMFGMIILACRQESGFSSEQRDFVGTCSYLVGSGLTALRLNSKVEAAQQKVVHASKLSAIGQLAAGVAHELNTPLATIALAIESAQLRPDKAAERLKKAEEAVVRAKEIVTGLLDHSQLGNSPREFLHPHEIVKSSLKLAEAPLSRRDIRIKVSNQQTEAKVLGSLTDFQQVLINLLLNAADASLEGQEIIIFSRQKGRVIELGVQDFGNGISVEHRPRIFEAFFSTKPPGTGTGLGLSVCRQLVARHQGKMTVHSEPGQGSTFLIQLPARVGKATAALT